MQTADGTVVKIKYEGPAELVVVDRNDEEHTICLPRAFYCPDMHNLLSVKQLMRLDYDVTYSRKRGSRVENDGTVIPIHLHDNLYQVRYRRTPRKAFDACEHADHDERVAESARLADDAERSYVL